MSARPKPFLLSVLLMIPACLMYFQCNKTKQDPSTSLDQQSLMIRKFVSHFFTTKSDVRSREPAAGLWEADREAFQDLMSSSFLSRDPELKSSQARKYAEGKLSTFRLFARFAIGQAIFLPIKNGTEFHQPMIFKLFEAQNVVPKSKNHRRYIGETEGQGKVIPISFEYRKEGETESLLYQEDGKKLKLSRLKDNPEKLKNRIIEYQKNYSKPVDF
jgi:hypothetical protein